MASNSSCYSGNPPCAACKFLRRRCTSECVFAPYFPPEEPQKFINVHKIFGASNVSKLLNEVLPHQREDTVNSLAYEADARVKDPVYGCVGAISVLQRQVLSLQKELDSTNADIIRCTLTTTNDLTYTQLHQEAAGSNSTGGGQQYGDHHHHHHHVNYGLYFQAGGNNHHAGGGGM